MNKSCENKTDVFQSRCLRRIDVERTTDKEVLQLAEIGNLSGDVRRRTWKFIGHIMKKDPIIDCKTALSCTPEGRRKRGRPKTTWEGRQRHKGKNWSEV